MSHSVEISQVASQWPQLVADMQSGDEVILTDHYVPKAQLTPLSQQIPGLHAGDFEVAADFDEPVSIR